MITKYKINQQYQTTLPLTSGDIELNLNGQTILSVGSTVLLKFYYIVKHAIMSAGIETC